MLACTEAYLRHPLSFPSYPSHGFKFHPYVIDSQMSIPRPGWFPWTPDGLLDLTTWISTGCLQLNMLKTEICILHSQPEPVSLPAILHRSQWHHQPPSCSGPNLRSYPHSYLFFLPYNQSTSKFWQDVLHCPLFSVSYHPSPGHHHPSPTTVITSSLVPMPVYHPHLVFIPQLEWSFQNVNKIMSLLSLKPSSKQCGRRYSQHL